MAASSSASLSMLKKYDYFLSFQDTRNNFTSHLYRALIDKEIETYIDSKSLDRGDEITPALLAAIQQSNIAVIVFSEHYASSSWCLAELVHILECHETEGLILLPVFYHVDPSDIRNQRGSYGVAFEKHEEKFEDSKVRAWRSALVKAANHSGWDSKDRVETDLIDDIVRDILDKLNNLVQKLSQRGNEFPTTTILEDEATSHKMREKITLKDLKKAGLTQLSKLKNSLKLSYDRLKDKRHQECLLYGALYPEDYPIERDLLIDQLIAVGIVDEMERGQVMLSHLVDVSLLIDTVDDSKAKCVKLHDSIRDMALQIMRENPTQSVAKAGEGVESYSVWNEGVKMVSLMRNKIVEIPSSIEPPNCPILSSLFLNQNYNLKSVPRNLFQQMLGLNVLDLSSTDIVELPESVSLLLNLSVLLLRWCRNLKNVPDLSKLSNMRRLDLSYTSIEEFPKGIENMVKLTYLNLRSTNLSSLPTGSLCNLTNLQYLDLSHTKLSSLPTGSLCNLTNLQYLSLVSTKVVLTITEELAASPQNLGSQIPDRYFDEK